MSLRRFLPKNRKTEAAQSSLQNDRQPTYTSNVQVNDSADSDSLSNRMRALSGSDAVSATLFDETESSLTDTLGVAETSEKATLRSNYSKRPSG